VLAGLRYDERADIFSFGVVLSEIDTDDYPYWNDKENQAAGKGPKPASDQTRIDIILRLVVAEHLRPQFAPNCPAPIRALAERCLQAEPSSRPSAGEIVQFLTALLQRPSLK
jgi:serine/threonine protein kinase